MLEADIRQVYLVDELQLGQRLNQALQGGHQAEFALLLSMLSPDVTDAPQHGGVVGVFLQGGQPVVNQAFRQFRLLKLQ